MTAALMTLYLLAALLAVPFSVADAIFSTYLIGLTDGATVWCLSISPTSVRAIQWPFLIPFEADFTQTALLFGRWSGPSQTSTFFKVRSPAVNGPFRMPGHMQALSGRLL